MLIEILAIEGSSNEIVTYVPLCKILDNLGSIKLYSIWNQLKIQKIIRIRIRIIILFWGNQTVSAAPFN